MEPLIALGGILLRAIPTFLLVWILYLYASRVFYRPLRQTLLKREQATEGLRKAAEARIALAEQKTAEYQEALRVSRAELYRQQEEEQRKAMERRAEILRQARQRAGEKLALARQEIQQEMQEARQLLARESEQMALWITRAILEPPPTHSPSRSSGVSSSGESGVAP